MRVYAEAGTTPADTRNLTYGSGAITVVSPANSAVAPTVPSLLYICPANSGNAAAKIVRIAALHVSASAATERYASTMYVIDDAKMKKVAVPNGTVASIGTIQCTPRYVVNASQKSPIGASTAPTCPIRSRNSGGGSSWPCASLYSRYLLWDTVSLLGLGGERGQYRFQ